MMNPVSSPDGQWPQAADFFLRLIGPPLRPTAMDIEIVEHHIGVWFSQHKRPPRALILGVTPEYYHLDWPDGALVRAVDRTQAMIDHVWPGPASHVSLADWLDLPAIESNLDFVLCDGGLHLLAYPAGQGRLTQLIAERLAPGGRCVFRLFAPASRIESPAQVLDALAAGQIANLNELKLRLGMAMQHGSEAGVKLDDIWHCLHRAFPDSRALAQRLGWSEAHLSAIDAYRGTSARYHFVTEAEAIATFSASGLVVCSRHELDYRLGERCPTLVFEHAFV